MYTLRTSMSLVALMSAFAGCADDAQDAADAPLGSALPAIATQSEQPIITEITPVGVGCPEDSWRIDTDPEDDAPRVVFKAWDLTLKETPLSTNSACTLNIGMRVPEGRRYALAGYEVRGYAALTPGARLEHAASYGFTDSAGPATTVRTVRGPHENDIDHEVTIPPASLVWSSCENPEKKFNLTFRSILRAEENAASPFNAFTILASIGKLDFITSPCP